MFSKKMDNRGQISAEYLLLMVIIILILSAVTIPLASKSIDASNDVSQASDAKVAVESIADAANVVYANGPGAKRKITVYIPQDNMTFFFNSKGISTNVTLSDGSVKTVTATTEYPLSYAILTVSKGSKNVIIMWYPQNNYISEWIG